MIYDPRPKPTFLAAAIQPGETVIDVVDPDHVHVRDVIQVIDYYAGSRDFLNWATADRLVVTDAADSRRSLTVAPLDVDMPLRAHPADAEVRIISRSVHVAMPEVIP